MIEEKSRFIEGKAIASMDIVNDDYKRERVVFYDKGKYVCVGYDKDDRPYLCPQDDLIVTRDFSLENMVDVERRPYTKQKATFENFCVKSYLPKTDDKEFYEMLKTGIERIKTNYPYADPTFCSLRLPSCGIDPHSNDELTYAAGYYDLNKNLFGFISADELEKVGEDVSDIYQHEILHLCSSRAKVIKGATKNSGIHFYYDTGYSDKEGNGIGINEGLTECLAGEIASNGHCSAYYVNRRLIDFMQVTCPSEEEFIKKYFRADLSGLDFIGDDQTVHEFVKNFDYLHCLDNIIFEMSDDLFNEKKEEVDAQYMSKHHKLKDIEDAPEEDLIELDRECLLHVEDNIMVPYLNCDFLPNCQDILLDVAKRKFESCEDKTEQLNRILKVMAAMVMPEEVDEVNQVYGAYSLNPIFINTEKLEGNREKLFDICDELGYERDEIKSIYDEVFEWKDTINKHLEMEGLSIYSDEYNETSIYEDEDIEFC